MSEHYWVDTNVILRFITQSPAEHAKLATAIMEAVDAGLYVLHVHPLIIAECCYMLQGKMFNLKHKEIAHIVRQFILADGIEADHEQVVLSALDDYEQERIDFEDAYLAAYAKHQQHRAILTFNAKDFERTSVECYTPAELLARP